MTPNAGLTFVALGNPAETPSVWREPVRSPRRQAGWIHVALMCVAIAVMMGVPDEVLPRTQHPALGVAQQAAAFGLEPVPLAPSSVSRIPLEPAPQGRVVRHRVRPRRATLTSDVVAAPPLVAALERVTQTTGGTRRAGRDDDIDSPMTPHQVLWAFEVATVRIAN